MFTGKGNSFSLKPDRAKQVSAIPLNSLSGWGPVLKVVFVVATENSCLVDIFRQLYPERKVYIHIPFNKRDFCRTRIDFWLVSSNISAYIKDVNYLPLISSLFDHKLLQLIMSTNRRAQNFINPKVLNMIGLDQIDKITSLNTYMDYIITTNENQHILKAIHMDWVSARIVFNY